MLETIELQAQLQRSGIVVAGLVVNKRSPVDAGAFLAERHAQEQRHLDTLQQALPNLPLQQLPLLAEDVVGEAALEAFGERLSRN